MSYYVNYADIPEAEKQPRAIQDIMEYLGTDNAHLFGDLVALATLVELEIPDSTGKVSTVQNLNLMFGFAGISGVPFHQFCKRYCPSKYAEWVNSDSKGQ